MPEDGTRTKTNQSPEQVAQDCHNALLAAKESGEWCIFVAYRIPPPELGGPYRVQRAVFRHNFPVADLGQCIQYMRHDAAAQVTPDLPPPELGILDPVVLDTEVSPADDEPEEPKEDNGDGTTRPSHDGP